MDVASGRPPPRDARRRKTLFAFTAFLGGTAFPSACVDGVTPDCSVATVCAPSEGDGSTNADASDGGATSREAGPDASAVDATTDGDGA